MTKVRVAYRFFPQTLRKLEKIVQERKKEDPAQDMTKVIEWLIRIFKLKGKK